MNLADALSGRGRLEGLRWMLLGAPSRVLRRELRALLSAPTLLGPCQLRRTQFRPGRKLTADYDVSFRMEGAGRRHVRPMQVVWRSDGDGNGRRRTTDLREMQAEAVRRDLSAPFRQLMADIPVWGMHVQVSPLDARFPQLVRVSDPRYVPDLLAAACAKSDVAPEHAPASRYAVTSIRYRPGNRHVLCYEALAARERGTMFAKLYAGEEGERAYSVATEVAEWLAEHGEGVSSARPLAYVAEDGVVVYARILGEPLYQHLKQSDHGVGGNLTALGTALCALHRLPPKSIGPLKLQDFASEAGKLARRSNYISFLLPSAGAAIETLLDHARELHERLPPEWPTFTHGDFISEHIWVAPGKMTLIDLDNARFSDPALEVGKFLADLRFCYAANDQNGLEQAQEQFLSGYRPAAPAERLVRARLYEALELVKMTVGRRSAILAQDWAPRTERLIGQAQALMNDLQLISGLPGRHPQQGVSRHVSEATAHIMRSRGDVSAPMTSHTLSYTRGRRNNTSSESVQPFADPGIPALAEVLDPMALAKHLRVSSLRLENGGIPEEVEVRVIRHHPGRHCTVEIGLRGQNGWHFLIGKVYHKDRADVFQAMEKIGQAGFSPQGEFSIPRPLAYLPLLCLLAQERVEGPLAKEVFKTGDEPNRAAAAERCAGWLARFHALAPRLGPVFESDRCLKQMRRYSRKIVGLGGRVADKAARLLQGLEDAASLLSPVEMRAGHGSYSAGQVILAEGRTVVFDWDGCDVADPARDVGRFRAALRHAACGGLGSVRALDAAAEIFLQTYLGLIQPDAKKNLGFYEAVACLKLAMHSLHRQDKAEAMLDEGIRVLGEEGEHIV